MESLTRTEEPSFRATQISQTNGSSKDHIGNGKVSPMRLKYRLAAFACAAAMATGTSALVASPALANVDNQTMCFKDSSGTVWCIEETGSGAIQVDDSITATYFNVPETVSGYITVSADPTTCVTTGSGKGVNLATCNKNNNYQQWIPTPISGDKYEFYNASVNGCLHAAAGGTALNVYTCNGDTNEIWYVSPNIL